MSSVAAFNRSDAQDKAATSVAFLEAIDRILPILKEHAAKTEQLRRLSDESIAALSGAGVFRALQPKRWGGLEIDPVTWFEAVVRVGTACGSSAWITGVVGGHNWHAAMFSEEAQQDLWGAGEETRIASSFAPTGKVKRVDGGFHLSGRWKFLSGIDHSNWIVLGGVAPDEGEGAECRNFLVPASDFKIDQDSWHVEGFQGTGSKDADLDAFVPLYRTQSIEEVYSRTEPGRVLNTAPVYQMPWLSMFAYAVGAPAIGAAIGALDAFIEDNRARVSAMSHVAAAQNPGLHVRLAEAATAISDAHARIPVTWGTFMEYAAAGKEVPSDVRAKCRFEGAYSISQCFEAAMKIFAISGGAVLHENKPFQRYLRDLMGMRNHPFGVYETWAGLYSTSLLGLPIDPPLSRDSMRCLY